eukprot:6196686-Pleurochrysis_carterae.AAC.2
MAAHSLDHAHTDVCGTYNRCLQRNRCVFLVGAGHGGVCRCDAMHAWQLLRAGSQRYRGRHVRAFAQAQEAVGRPTLAFRVGFALSPTLLHARVRFVLA